MRALTLVLRVGVAGLALAGAGFVIADYPVLRLPLVMALGLFALVLWWRPPVWLIVIPALIPILDLTPWSGRLVVNELDAFVLTAIAMTWLRLWPPTINAATLTLWSLLVVTGSVSILLGWHALGVGVGVSDLAYFLPENAWRVGKALLFAALLLPGMVAIESRAPHSTIHHLAKGLQLGIAFLAVSAFWERGGFAAALEWQGARELAAVLLSFSGSYRITGLFSGMHTGGEAIDGYLSLALPFAVYAMARARTTVGRLLGIAIVAGGLYALAATFTRTTYFAVAVALLMLILLAAYINRNVYRQWAGTAFGLVGAVIVLTLMFFTVRVYLGFQPLFAGLLCFAAVLLSARHRSTRTFAVLGLGALLALFFFGYEMVDEFRESTSATALMTFGMTLSACLVLVLGAFWMGTVTRERVSGLNFLTGLMVMIVAWGLLLPIAGGWGVAERFAQTRDDSATRTRHYSDVWELRGPDVLHQLFGSGVGTFPLRYTRAKRSETVPPSYRQNTGDTRFLTLEPSELTLTQRVSIPAKSHYRVGVRIRSHTSGARLRYRVCGRNILYFAGMGCPGGSLEPTTAGTWQELTGRGRAGEVGVAGRWGWPMTLHLEADRGAIDLDVVTLVADGKAVLRNGDFEEGLDRWFVVSDYDHLPWHAKNNYLHLLVEQGWVGLALFMLLTLYCIFKSARGVLGGVVPAAVGLVSIVGFSLVGILGSPLDMPPIAFLFYVICAASSTLVWSKSEPTTPRRSRRRRQDRVAVATQPEPPDPPLTDSREINRLRFDVDHRRLRISDTSVNETLLDWSFAEIRQVAVRLNRERVVPLTLGQTDAAQRELLRSALQALSVPQQDDEERRIELLIEPTAAEPPALVQLYLRIGDRRFTHTRFEQTCTELDALVAALALAER